MCTGGSQKCIDGSHGVKYSTVSIVEIIANIVAIINAIVNSVFECVVKEKTVPKTPKTDNANMTTDNSFLRGEIHFSRACFAYESADFRFFSACIFRCCSSDSFCLRSSQVIFDNS